MQHAPLFAQTSERVRSATSPRPNYPVLSRCADAVNESTIDTNKEMQTVLSDQVIFTLDVDGNIQFVNEAGERLTGYTAVELAQLNVLDLLPGHGGADLRAMVQRSIRHRVGTVFEIKVTTRDRRRILIEVSIELIRRPDKKREIRGIAVPKDDAAACRRPRCLDLRFQFKPSKPLNAVLHTAG
jgi:PAS domain S-box-containing protein